LSRVSSRAGSGGGDVEQPAEVGDEELVVGQLGTVGRAPAGEGMLALLQPPASAAPLWLLGLAQLLLLAVLRTPSGSRKPWHEARPAAALPRGSV
jgi:hypothetical protein